MPDSFVLKTTHDSGSGIVVKDKNSLDMTFVQKKLEKSLNYNYYMAHREYPYKYVKPQILAEKYMIEESETDLREYKLFCFDGECKMLYVATDRSKDDIFDTDFNHLSFSQAHPQSNKSIIKPRRLDEMIVIAEKLSKGFPSS